MRDAFWVPLGRCQESLVPPSRLILFCCDGRIGRDGPEQPARETTGLACGRIVRDPRWLPSISSMAPRNHLGWPCLVPAEAGTPCGRDLTLP